MIKHYFEFITTQRGLIQVDEPIGFDQVGFSIKQDDGRKGRDVSSSGNSEAKYKMVFYNQRYGYALNELKLEFTRFGDQANVIYHQDFGSGIVPFGNIDMQTFAEYSNRVEFVVIALSSESEYKTTFDLPTNLFSPTDLKGNPITQCQPVRVFIPVKPIYAKSVWENTSEATEMYLTGRGNVNPGFFNSIKNLTTSEIKASLSGNLYDTSIALLTTYDNDPRNFKIISALDNLRNVKAKFQLHIKSEVGNMIPGSFNVKGVFGLGKTTDSFQDFVNAVSPVRSTVFYDSGDLGTGLPFSNEYNGTLNIDLPDMNRGDVLYFVFFHQGQDNNNIIESKNTIYTSKLTITANQVTYNRVIEAVRYIDAIKYAVKSASGLEVSAPMYEQGGEDYNQFITNPQLMRGLNDRPVYISNKDIIDHIRAEKNGDYEVTPTPSIFIGKYKDFYRDELMGFYNRLVREDDNIETNTRYSFNKFQIEYKNYAAQKENENGNTLDTVHGNAVYTTPKLRVNNSREASINFIRDAILWQQYIDKSNDLKSSQATQDDEKIFIVDCIQNNGTLSFTENSFLQHAGNGNTLTLKNDSSFSFVGLGIDVSSQFTINSTQNAGTYFVLDVNPQQMTMFRNDGVTVQSYDEVNTNYTYRISEINVPFVARTNEGFTIFNNLDPQGAINTRFTLARIMRDSYSEELATNVLYSNGLPIRNASYLYNPDAATKYLDNEVIVEGANYNPTGALVNGKLFDLKLVLNYAEYMELVSKIRTIRGYIKTKGFNGLPLMGFIKNIEWQPVSKGIDDIELFNGEADVTLEEKYSEFDLYIFREGQTILINGETQPVGIQYEIDEYGYVTFYDVVGMELEVKVLYDRVKVNNSQKASTPIELAGWLSLIQLE